MCAEVGVRDFSSSGYWMPMIKKSALGKRAYGIGADGARLETAPTGQGKASARRSD